MREFCCFDRKMYLLFASFSVTLDVDLALESYYESIDGCKCPEIIVLRFAFSRSSPFSTLRRIALTPRPPAPHPVTAPDRHRALHKTATMKFRADLSNSSTLLKIINSLAPLSKIATLKLTRENLHLICRTPGENVQVWSCVFSYFTIRRAGVIREAELSSGGVIVSTGDLLARDS